MKHIILFVLLTFQITVNSQNFSSNSIRVGVGIGIQEGFNETGMGAVMSFGYQKSVWKNRLRLNPTIVTGNFLPVFITDVRDQYYRLTSLGFNAYLDILKFRAVSIYIGGGGFVSYTRGLLGPGGWDEEHTVNTEYFFKPYMGGLITTGIRIDVKSKRVAFELIPFNICFGTDYYFLAYPKFEIDIKLNKRVK